MIDLSKTLQNFGGVTKLMPEANAFSAMYGATLDAAQQAAYSALTNRFSRLPDGYGLQESSCILSEFGLPADPRLVANKWTHIANRYTKQGLFDMLSAVGHPYASVYNFIGRTDSDHAVYTNWNPPNQISLRYSWASQYSKMFSRIWTLVVWDMQDTTDVHYGYKNGALAFGTSDATAFISAGSGSPLGIRARPPAWAYCPQPDWQILCDIANYHVAINELLMEVLFVYPNNAGGYSQIDSTGNPVTLGLDWVSYRWFDYCKLTNANAR